MDTGKEIYFISAAMLVGTGIAAALSALSASPPAQYVLAAVWMPALAVLSAIPRTGRFKGASTTLLYWCVVFVLAGLSCHALWRVISTTAPHANPLAEASARIENVIESIPFRDTENKALLKALILGDTDSLSRGTVNDFRTAGAAHLLALSGMHLGIIYAILYRGLVILGNSPLSRKIRGLATIAVTAAYTLMCGARPSLVRAFLFILLNEAARMSERPQPPQHIFCAALTLHLITSPGNVSDIGFQLSWLAMTGIVFVWPHIKGWVNSAVWRAASLCISCQLFTAPLTVLYFGTFPKYFLITNLAASPLMTVVMGGGITAVAASWAGVDAPWLYTAAELPATLLRKLLGIIAGM